MKKGLTLVEAMIAVVVLGIVAVFIIQIESYISGNSVRIRERAFATQKAIQMLEELRSLVSGQEQMQINVLDNYNDGSTFNPVLTTNKSITDPGNALSGNSMVNGHWKYLRQISVLSVPNDVFSRQVYVRVYLNTSSGKGTPTNELIETSSILKTISAGYVPTEVYDVYIISIENVPGWWSSLSIMTPSFEQILTDLQLRNPGLELRTHWISRLAYGRDPYYTPYVNYTTYTNTTVMPYVYFYPGLMSLSDGTDFYYYDASTINGRINVDGTVQNNGGYSMCDMYNHAVRYPEEVRLYGLAVSAAQTAGRAAPEISLRMLLEEMNSNPGQFVNALIINLHGELLPVPPMRNYSDAAKDPANYPNQRVVTHPEKMSYHTTDQVNLRVYPYCTFPAGFTGQYYNGTNFNTLEFTRRDPCVNFDWSVVPPDPPLTASNISVHWNATVTPQYSEAYTFETTTRGGVRLWVDGTLTAINDWIDNGLRNTFQANPIIFTSGTPHSVQMDFYNTSGAPFAALKWSSPSQAKSIISFPDISTTTIFISSYSISANNITVTKVLGTSNVQYSKLNVQNLTSGTTCQVANVSGGTLITLYDSPVTHPYSNIGGVSGGLTENNELYGLEYIPCPVGNDFTCDLVTSSTTKNTARWIISFASNTFNPGMVTIDTRLGQDLNTGVIYNLSNLSRTYVWISTTVPYTEQFQYVGDPRHCPYLDVKQNNGYNWFFTSVPNTQFSYTGFTQTANGCDTDQVAVDLPRFYQTFRNGILSNRAVWSAMNGFSYFYFGMGGEFGSDQDPLPDAVPFLGLPWSNASNNNFLYVDEILPYAHGNCNFFYGKIAARKDNAWYSQNWTGEIYPDSEYSNWQVNGNIATGTNATNFYRTDYTTFPVFNRKLTARACSEGCESFINGTQAGQTGPFRHDYEDGYTGDLTNLGLTVSSIFNFPLITTISAPRPFKLNYGTSDLPTEWNNAVYQNMRTVISVPSLAGTSRIYYNFPQDSSFTGSSGVVKIALSTNTCYLVVSGLATEADFGSLQMGEYVLASMLYTFLDAGMYTGQDKIPQVPMVTITQPTLATSNLSNPSAITVSWSANWIRWDNQSYTPNYPAGYSETTALVYSVKYSMDDGKTWAYCTDNSPTSVGARDSLHTASAASYTWNVSSLPQGTVIVRVECYRNAYASHYSYDQIQVYITR